MLDVADRLRTPDLRERLDLLGFRPDDAADVQAGVAVVLESTDALHRIGVLAERLLAAVGEFCAPGDGPFDCPEARTTEYAAGLLPMLALFVTADEVRAFHASKGISDEISWRSLSDLGQQVWVHRLTYGEFGLHTQGWLCCAWSGAFFWLGRLQYNLALDDMAGRSPEEWVLSTHIPQTGPLPPESVDESFAMAADFFGMHFADFGARDLFCNSWLLDPKLPDVLPAESNMVRFQQRWSLYGQAQPGDKDALFFTFRRRGDVDLDSLPRDTTLHRAVIDRIRAGDHWGVWRGRVLGGAIS